MRVEMELAASVSVVRMSDDKPSIALDSPSTLVEMLDSTTAMVDEASRMVLVGVLSVSGDASWAKAPALSVAKRRYGKSMTTLESVEILAYVLQEQQWCSARHFRTK